MPAMALRLIYAAVVVVAAVLAYKAMALNGAMETLRQAPFGNAIGAEDAPYTIVEFIDYRCSFCRELNPAVKSFVEKNPDVRVVFRHFPVYEDISLHDIQLALAAGIQGKYQDVHERLMARAEPINDEYISEVSDELGLDYQKLREDLKGRDIGIFLLDNIDYAKMLGVNATPTFLIGDIIYAPDGHYPTEEDFRRLIDQAYGK